MILESMARAGELDEAERIGRLNPEGVPKALAALALKIAQARFREKAAVEPGVNPVAVFALSVKLSKSEAVSAAKNFNVPWNFICAPGPGCTDRKAVLKRKWKKEQSRREALREAETLIALAFQMKKAGLHGSAYAAVQRGVRLAERSGMPDKFHCERSTWEEQKWDSGRGAFKEQEKFRSQADALRENVLVEGSRKGARSLSRKVLFGRSCLFSVGRSGPESKKEVD